MFTKTKSAIVAAFILGAASASMNAPAIAQQSKASVYKYCLNEGRPLGGQILCRYNTMAQCWASRTGPSDQCYLNTAYYQRGR